MKLTVGKPHPLPLQRRDTNMWIEHGTIAIHNDESGYSIDVEAYGTEFETKEEAVRSFIQRAKKDFVKKWLIQLHG